MKRSFRSKLALSVLTAVLTIWGSGAFANDFHGGFGHPFFRDPGFHGRFDHRAVVPRHFVGPRDRWVSGHWLHDWHGGRFGWWWVVDGSWFFYPAPVYPYPAYYGPPAATWYYCANPQGYYPNVATCSVPWQAVPATPAPPPAG